MVAQSVSDKIDVRGGLFLQIVVRRAKTLDHAARAEVASADADDDKRLGIALYPLRACKDAVVLRAVVPLRKADPADEIVPLSAAVEKVALRPSQTGTEDLLIGVGQEGPCVRNIDRKHIDFLLA